MKVAFFTYPSAFQNVGGGEIQLLKTKEYLEKAGVQVKLFDPWTDRVENFDILHIFSSVGDCRAMAQAAHARKVKVVTSPVLWSDINRAFHTDGSVFTKADFIMRYTTKVLWPTFPSARRKLLLLSDLILPNSEAEKKQIARHFAIPETKIESVPNGVSPEFLDANPATFKGKYGPKPFILGVGRIEPRKNQLNLIRAVKKLADKRLILIGSPVSGYEAYYQACVSEGKGFVTFIPTLSHEDPLLRSAYAACDLFVLQGWFETPGLAALEAALVGAKVIVTSGGSTREYFSSYVDYLDPADINDIAAKISKGLARPNSPDLKQHVISNYTWDKVAKKTLSCYESLLNEKAHAKR